MLKYNGSILRLPSMAIVGDVVPYQSVKLIGSTSTPVYFSLSNGGTYTVTSEQDIRLYKGDSLTISAHSIQGKTFSLQGLDYCDVSNVTWNHKSYTGSYVTANATLTGTSNSTLYLGLSNERDKQYSAYCVWPSSTNQAACSNYQPGIYVSTISSNCHGNGYWHDNDCTDFEQLTSASKGTCERGGNGTKGWTTYDGGVSDVYIASDVFGWNKVQHWSAHMNMTNITAAAASPVYLFWGNTSAGNQTNQRMYGSGTYARGSTKTVDIERDGLTGAGCPYCIENQNGRPVNHYGWYTFTANMR